MFGGSSLLQFDGMVSARTQTLAASTSSRTTPTQMVRQPFVVEAKKMTPRESRERRHKRIRKKVDGTDDRPRLAVFRSNQHIYAQVIDDSKGHTLVAASTLAPTVKAELGENSAANKDAAALVGKAVAEACLAKNISKVAFDRGGFLYHGRVQALAEAAREAGLQF